MKRPPLVPEIRLLGLVVVRKARGKGAGYVVGEPHGGPRRRPEDQSGERLVRVNYLDTPGAALLRAVGRARRLAGSYPPAQGASDLLGATAGLYGAEVVARLPGVAVREARAVAGLTQAGLARKAKCSRTTVRDVEADRVRPNTLTLARLLGACRKAEGGKDG